MARIGLAPEMFGRLSAVLVVMVGMPVLAHALVTVPLQSRAAVIHIVAKTVVNPYGAIQPLVSVAHRDQPSDTSTLSQIVKPKAKGLSSAKSSKLPIGCEALGGVSSALSHVPGKCLS